MFRRTVTLAVTMAFWGAGATLCFPDQPKANSADGVGWVGLFNDDLATWLENENQLERLCGDMDPGDAKRQACRTEKLAPKVAVIRLFTGPSEGSSRAGSMTIVAKPGDGLHASFTSPGGRTATPFTPDLFDADWGYGPYFHQTFLARRGTWFLLPVDPFRKDTWFNAAELGPEPQVRLLEAGDLVTSRFGDLFILAIEPGIVHARREQDADMWCDVDPPALERFTPLRLPVRQLYDARGHLQIHIKYTRGC
jgi:hypothetical protein